MFNKDKKEAKKDMKMAKKNIKEAQKLYKKKLKNGEIKNTYKCYYKLKNFGNEVFTIEASIDTRKDKGLKDYHKHRAFWVSVILQEHNGALVTMFSYEKVIKGNDILIIKVDRL